MLQHEHFGKLRPHRHTSYASLLFVLVLGALLLVGISISADAANPPNPQSGSVGLTGTVNGPAPKQSATIVSPSSGSTVSSIPITVTGGCPAGTFVTIIKNNVFGGAVPCTDAGSFSLQVDLFDGSNTLVARDTDALGQNGPDSGPVSVFYNAPALAQPAGAAEKQLFADMSTTILAGQPGQGISRTISIVGGVGPYAVEWDWGDGNTTLMSQAAQGNVTASHAYTRPGTYNVIVRITDSLNNSAFMQFVTVVNGPVAVYGSAFGTGLTALPGQLVTAWPLYILAAFMVVTFWLGERLEVRKLRRRHMLVDS